MFRRDKGAVMDRNKDNVAVSALYTSAVWQWAGLPGAELVTPPDAERVFRFVNGYMRFYQRINPHIFSLPHQLLPMAKMTRSPLLPRASWLKRTASTSLPLPAPAKAVVSPRKTWWLPLKRRRTRLPLHLPPSLPRQPLPPRYSPPATAPRSVYR